MKKMVLLALGALLLVACDNAEKAAPAPSPSIDTAISVESSGRAELTIAGDQVTATRTRDGAQGITITPSAHLVTLTIEGEGAVLRVRQGGEWIERPASASESIMIGRGGASMVRVQSVTADTLVVHVVQVVPCSEVTCAPLPSQPGATTDSPEASDDLR